MSKIFRLSKDGAATYQDWNRSPAFPYNSTSRDAIEDPDSVGVSSGYQITSIPSPFARIDLVKTAFKEVCKSDKLDGQTTFHRMVSDTLDVAEIFFNIDKYNGKIEIISWDSSLMLAELRDSKMPGHRYLADAFRKFLVSDSATYNFAGGNMNIYLLNYIQGPDELNIIGATSPATLFFSSANDLSYVNDIFFGTDKPFDSELQPLYKRDPQFVTYMFALRASIENFAGLFPEVDDYLGKTYGEIKDPTLKETLRNANQTYLNQLSRISVSNARQSDRVDVLGHPLYKKTAHNVAFSSDFTIRTTKTTALKPLVLPIDSGTKYSDLQYTVGKWGKTNAAPCHDRETDISKRTLPFDGIQSPYLTIGDFLEDVMIKVPHALNSENYFNGNLAVSGRNQALSYLLPVRPLLFEYFTADEIRGNMADGEPMFEMRPLAGNAVKVCLRIPINGSANVQYIEYARCYYNYGNSQNTDISKNEGNIKDMSFTGFVMPMVKFDNASDAVYNISCVQDVGGRNEFVFYEGSQRVMETSRTCRNDNMEESFFKADNYLLEGRNFDYIQVRNKLGYCGVMIPIFRQQRNIGHFEFAIDLGTSNTHIEFRRATDDEPEAFTFGYKDRQLCEMFIPVRNEAGRYDDLREETELIEKDFIPSEIGRSDFHFPTRTVLSCAKIVDWTNVVYPFTLVNLPFTYDKRSDLPYNNYEYNIKWGNENELRVMESYVHCLMLIIRNKVLMNNGDLQRTRITWFYPISMAPKRLSRLRNIWDDAYGKYFGKGGTTCMTESAAPIQYFFKRFSTATDLINIDIGGGTTDIAFAKDRMINYVTSFRFASNDLFENSFSELDFGNGIVDRFKERFHKILGNRGLKELCRVCESSNNRRPANMASFLFGLRDNTIVQNAGINATSIDFNHILQADEDFKIVFIIFYTAIIYHVAQIVKTLGLEMPRHISFSGNGSRVIRIITSDTQLLVRYTKLIFEKVLEKEYVKELDLIGLEKDSDPKEFTCKGGIIGMEKDAGQGSMVVFKGDGTGIAGSSDTYAAITDEYRQGIVSAVENFFNFVLIDMNKEFGLDKNFGVKASSIRIAQEIARKDLDTFLEKGINQCREENEADSRIEETFFFYPIKGVLNAISTKIYEELQKQ